MTHNILVVGYGNELRGDDGLGPFLARSVARQGRPDVDVAIVPQLVPELAVRLASAERVLFIDARRDRADVPVDVIRLEPSPSGDFLGHTGDPRTLLALVQSLEGHVPESWWITVAGYDFELGERLSPAALANARIALDRIEEFLNRSPAHR